MSKRFGRIAIGRLRGMTPAERIKGRYMRDGEGHPSDLAKLLERHSAALEAKFIAQGRTIEEVKGQLLDLEQKAARHPGAGPVTETYGQQIVSSPRFQDYQAHGYQGKCRIELKAITSVAGSGGGMIVSERDMDLVRQPQRSVRVRDLLTVIPTSSGSVDYPKQTTRTNNANVQAEGTAKAYSEYGWTLQNLPMRTIAHLAKLSRQAFDDATQLQAEVDNEMRYGLQLKEDQQLLYGDGTGQNLTGLMVNATAYAAPAGITVTSPQQIDKIGLAIIQLALAEYEPDGIILNPTDWGGMYLLKDAAGGYLTLNPGDATPKRLFGLPVAVTTALTPGTFGVGAFRKQKLYDRMAPEVLISSENADDFERNLLTMRCEERLGVAIREPGAIVRGSF